VYLWPCSKKRKREAEEEEARAQRAKEVEKRKAEQEARAAAERKDMQRISALIAQSQQKRVRGHDALDIVRIQYFPHLLEAFSLGSGPTHEHIIHMYGLFALSRSV
jgi:hypothetical protein